MADRFSTDFEEARLFMELLTGSPNTTVTFQTFHDKGNNGRLAQIIHGSVSQCEGRLTTLNECGAGVFVTINETNGMGRTKNDIVSIRAVFMDCDTPEADPLRLIEESGFDPDWIVESSPGKFHAYRRVSGFPLDEDLFRGVQLLLADRVQGDEKVKDISRVMRLPGLLHQKGESVMTRVHKVPHPGRVTAFADLMAALGITEDQARQRAKAVGKAKATAASAGASSFVTPDDFHVVMKDGDGRDNHMMRLAGHCAQRWMTEELALAHIRAWNERNIDPLPDNLIVSAVQRMTAKEKEKRAGFALTELGFSERVVHALSPTHRYVSDAGAWIVWNGTSWDWDAGATSMQEGVKGIARGLIVEAAQVDDHHRREALVKHNAKCENSRVITAAIKLARSSVAMSVQTGALDQHHMLLSCDNAVIDLRTGAAMAPDPFKLMTHRAHVEYDSTAQCPRWERFVFEVFGGHLEMIRYVQKVLGYCLTGDTREELAFIFVGGGANGKSTLLNTVQMLMGDYAQRLPSSALMVHRGASGGTGPTPEIARLRGARLAVTSEVATGRQLDEELLKNLVSQDPIAARFMRQDTFQFLPTHKLVFALNHLPTIASGDHGTWRRLRVIPFNCTFEGENKDAGLSEKLKAEAPGILNWLIAGCLRWQEEGLKEPDAVKVRTAEYRTDLDIVGQFLAEACYMGKDDKPEHRGSYKTAAALLYQSYRRYCGLYGLPWVSARIFGEDLKTRGLHKVRTAAGFTYSGVLVHTEWLPEGAEKLAAV